MINLLPDNTKVQLRAARVNVILLRYIIVIVIAFAFVAMVLAGSYVLLTQTKTSAEQLIAANDTKAQAFSQTQAEISQLSGTLSGAKSILDQQIIYSDFLRTLGQTMPAGTVMESLTLNDAAFNGTPVVVKVYATSSDAAVGLREQFQANPAFSSVNIESISETGGIDGYPVSASLTLTINRSQP